MLHGFRMERNFWFSNNWNGKHSPHSKFYFTFLFFFLTKMKSWFPFSWKGKNKFIVVIQIFGNKYFIKLKFITLSFLIYCHLGTNMCLDWQSRTSGSQWTLEVMRWLAWMRWPRLFSALRTRTFPSITFQVQRVCVAVTQTTHWSKRSLVGLQQWN